jgi:hypothetical protein
LSIVLECVPLPQSMSKIEAALAGIIKPIPSRPRQTKVEVEPAQRRGLAAAPPPPARGLVRSEALVAPRQVERRRA